MALNSAISSLVGNRAWAVARRRRKQA